MEALARLHLRMAKFCFYKDELDNLIVHMPHKFKPDYHTK